MNKTAGTQTLKAMHVQSVKGGLVHVDYFHPADPLAKGGHFPRCRTGGQNSRGTIYAQTDLAVTCSKCLAYIARHEAAGSSFYPQPPADAEPVTVVKVIAGTVEEDPADAGRAPHLPALNSANGYAIPAPPADLQEEIPMDDTTPTPESAPGTPNATGRAILANLAAAPVKGGAHIQVARGLALAAAQIRREIAAHTGPPILLVTLRGLAADLEDQALMSASMEGPVPAGEAPGWPNPLGRPQSVLDYVAAGMEERRRPRAQGPGLLDKGGQGKSFLTRMAAGLADVPVGEEIPGQPGYIKGQCGHRVAATEWRAGFRTCERCVPPVGLTIPGAEEPGPTLADLAAASQERMAELEGYLATYRATPGGVTPTAVPLVEMWEGELAWRRQELAALTGPGSQVEAARVALARRRIKTLDELAADPAQDAYAQWSPEQADLWRQERDQHMAYLTERGLGLEEAPGTGEPGPAVAEPGPANTNG